MSKIVGILLAAGSAKRFGAPKLLHPLSDGVTIGVAAANILLQAAPESIAVVKTGDHDLIDALSTTGITVVENSRADEGMGTSLATGVNATADADGWLITLADMPWVQPETIIALADQLKQGASIIVPIYQGQRGHPVGFSARWRGQLQELSGDKGARDLIANNSDELKLLTTEDSGVIKDIDHAQDLDK